MSKDKKRGKTLAIHAKRGPRKSRSSLVRLDIPCWLLDIGKSVG